MGGRGTLHAIRLQGLGCGVMDPTGLLTGPSGPQVQMARRRAHARGQPRGFRQAPRGHELRRHGRDSVVAQAPRRRQSHPVIGRDRGKKQEAKAARKAREEQAEIDRLQKELADIETSKKEADFKIKATPQAIMSYEY